jgi:protein-disulfide isomerase
MTVPFELVRLLPLLALLLVSGCGDEAAANADDPPAAASPPAQEAPGDPSAQTEQGAQAQPQPVDLSGVGHDEGDPETSVVRVIEFSDFGCVHCANFHLSSYPELYEEFIEAGDVMWKYIPITIGGFPNGDLAAVAGECAAQQDDFAGMRDRLFEIREEWMRAEEPAAMFVDEAETFGLDGEAFRACLTEEGEARERIEANDRLALRIGVRATPTFVVQGHPVEGAPPLSAFQEVLRELVAEARDPSR